MFCPIRHQYDFETKKRLKYTKQQTTLINKKLDPLDHGKMMVMLLLSMTECFAGSGTN
jgi:hypothetical protein